MVSNRLSAKNTSSFSITNTSHLLITNWTTSRIRQRQPRVSPKDKLSILAYTEQNTIKNKQIRFSSLGWEVELLIINWKVTPVRDPWQMCFQWVSKIGEDRDPKDTLLLAKVKTWMNKRRTRILICKTMRTRWRVIIELRHVTSKTCALVIERNWRLELICKVCSSVERKLRIKAGLAKWWTSFWPHLSKPKILLSFQRGK